MIRRALLPTAVLLTLGISLVGAPVHSQGVVLRWSLPGAGDSHVVEWAAIQDDRVTLEILGPVADSRPDVALECQNPATLEQGSAPLIPLATAPNDGGLALQFDLAHAWADLPYPVDPWGMQSKPLAIIGQRNNRAPINMTPAEIRAEFEWTRGYMLETARHNYRLPLGDGLLECVFRLQDNAGAAVSPPLTVAFGRGLPETVYTRDFSPPVADTSPTWVIDAAFVPELTDRPAQGSAELRDQLDTLLNLQSRRGAEQMALIRRWDDGSAVVPWIDVALGAVLEGYVNPPRAARIYALVSVAMNDALVASARAGTAGRVPPCQLESALEPVGPACSSEFSPLEHAVVAGAASTMLGFLFPDRAAEFDALAREAAESRLWAGTSLPADIEAGLALGQQVAHQVINRARSDRSDAVFAGSIPEGPDVWVPTPPAFAGPQEPMTGQWLPWNLARPDQFRPGPPPRPGTPEFEAEAREVYEVGIHLSIAQQEIASDWEDKGGTYTPSGHWNAIAARIVRERGLSSADAARLFATMNTAQADAFIAAWDAKYAYWSIRPVTAIQRLFDPDWRPYIYTPPFPSYISGHSTTSGAAVTVLSGFFPDRADELMVWAEEAAVSRLYGGIHFRSDNEVGLQVGQQVGSAALEFIQTVQGGI